MNKKETSIEITEKIDTNVIHLANQFIGKAERSGFNTPCNQCPWLYLNLKQVKDNGGDRDNDGTDKICHKTVNRLIFHKEPIGDNKCQPKNSYFVPKGSVARICEGYIIRTRQLGISR